MSCQIIVLTANEATIHTPEWGHRAYCNSAEGRAILTEEVPADIVAAIMIVWGDAPTVPDIAAEDVAPPGEGGAPDPAPDQSARIAELEAQLAQLTAAINEGATA